MKFCFSDARTMCSYGKRGVFAMLENQMVKSEIEVSGYLFRRLFRQVRNNGGITCWKLATF
ncbi:MAG: hypothetical protein A2X82_12565 [Geobacteraceae bacterium GWC2_55_20]|nr:MAG: hypothetical protein A2X82_12565 [Geobacteraceae bacterium GWC2_55_20]HBA72571.1 hypothetical protein [Geobacter sp.]HCE67339.1 hypothetical protein [Geobacter sp.]